MAEATIRIQDLSVIRGQRRLLNAVNLSLPASGIHIVMGPNGAGKSLLLRCLNGLETPTHGTIEASFQRQAMVFQTPVLLRRSVMQNLCFAAPKLTHPEIMDALNQVRLADKATQGARQLSGGEQQRLALARALLCQPDLLLLDEPTASLDPASTQLIEQRLAAQREQGTCVVMVSHDIGQAKRLADQVIFMHQGKITEQQGASAFFTTPRSAAARAYLAGELVLDSI